MTSETLEALKKSIRKWQLIVEGKEEDRGALNCALCHMFNDSPVAAFRCMGCPVAQFSGEQFCRNTPYVEYSKRPTAQNAQAMVDYLKALLPVGLDAPQGVATP